MDFWATLWASVWGALAGALVAYFLALDLRRRQSRSDYQDRMDAAIVGINTAVRLVARTKRASRWKRLGTFSRPRAIVDEEIILSALERGLVIADRKDLPVLEMFRTRMAAYFDGTTGTGRNEALVAALRASEIYPRKTASQWLLHNVPLRTAFAFWSSWERIPLEAAGVLLRWRRGEISAAEAVRELDPKITPVYELDLSTYDRSVVWANASYRRSTPRVVRRYLSGQDDPTP